MQRTFTRGSPRPALTMLAARCTPQDEAFFVFSVALCEIYSGHRKFPVG